MRLLPAIALFMALGTGATPALAQTPAGRADPAAVSGGSYRIDKDHTLVVWTVDHFGITPYTGIFGDITGSMTLDPRQPAAAKLDVTIPVSKLVTASAGLNQHLLRPGKDGGKPDFFGAAPADARFVSTRVEVQGQRARVTGDLTLNGVTRPVVLDVAFHGAGRLPPRMGGGETVGFRATTTILRSQFGIGYAIPMVSDAVRLEIAAAFLK